jgi:hypothetical protein
MATRVIDVKEGKLSAYEETGRRLTVHTWTISVIGTKIRIESTSRAGGVSAPSFIPLRDGKIFLVNTTDNHYFYFRESRFQEWMEARGIRAIKKENPNQAYSLEDYFWTNQQGRENQTIETDGVTEQLLSDWKETPRGSSCWWNNKSVKVTGATYVIVRGMRTTILYTEQKNVMSLQIPTR